VRLGVEAVLKRETRTFRYEYHVPSPKPSHWYELSVEPLEHVDGGAVVAHLDITDRRVAEIRADETRRQVAHMGRLAVVGELAATMSHELRQPLTAIRTNAEAGTLLLRDAPELSEVRAIFKDIVGDDARASEIIDNIRMLLRKEEPTTRAVDLNEICRHAAQLLKGDATVRGARLALSLEPQLPLIAGNPVQLQQVVLNLALNALDATAGSPGECEVVVGTAARGNETELFVRDTGPGLSPELQEHLFESFYTTKAQGLGLGLVIVRSIVERHHGRVYAENAAGRGAVFRVLLPVPPVSSVR
jgi:two-component system sensor kinase FixL